MVHARDSKIRGACYDIYDRFEIFRGSMEKAFGLNLCAPYFGSVGDIGKFCSGLIEGQSSHPWKLDFQRQKASLRTRMSIAFSLFLFRKLIPNEKPQLDKYAEKMSEGQPPPDGRFLLFCKKEVRRLFHIGWDYRYQDICTKSVLPISSCSENGRKHGGSRGTIRGMGLVEDPFFMDDMDREEFSRYVSESVAPKPRGVSQVQAVLAGGKWRAISIPPVWDNALRPFHSCLYDAVSKFDWCLRGDALPRSFKSFHRTGELFVSGDYESATDNLNSEVQRTILNELIVRSRHIPSGIKSHALSTFNSTLSVDGTFYEQRRGQLMGQLLSFPLLCLVNYFAFKFSIPRDVPVKINGDDIVFRAREDEVDRWRENVNSSGLKLSVGKTLINRRFFSLNSSLFESTNNGARFVPFLRPKALWGCGERECEKLASLAPRFRSYAVGFGRLRRSVFDEIFIRENLATVLRCRRSLTRGMGMKVSEDTLRSTGLWFRELYYLEKLVEPPLPAFSFSQLKCSDIPSGWVQVSAHWHPTQVVKGWSYRLSHEMVRSAWTRRVISDSEAEKKWMQRHDEGVSPWGLKCYGTFKRSLLRMSRRQVWRFICIPKDRGQFGLVRYSRGKGVWMPGTYVPCDKEWLVGRAGEGVVFQRSTLIEDECLQYPLSLL
jgi:hypothetical protein